MARYIDADALCVFFKALAEQAETERLLNQAHLYKRCLQLVNDAPTADVVPKSEVDWNSIPVDVSEALKQRAVEKAKAEVAREIIEIINDRIDNIRARTPYGGRAQGKTLALEKMRLLETLKVEIVKKYTEGKK